MEQQLFKSEKFKETKMSEAAKKEEREQAARIARENRNAKCLLCDYVGTCPPAVCQHLKKVHDQKMKKDTNWDYTMEAPTSATKVVKDKQPLYAQTYSNPMFATDEYAKMTPDEFLEALEKKYGGLTAIDKEYDRQLGDGYNAGFEDYISPDVSMFAQPHICGSYCHHPGDTNHEN